MWQLAIILPSISLTIERFLELFDALVMLNLFPWWRSAPVPPPAMFLQKPLRGAWDRSRKATDGDDEFDKPFKIIYAFGLSKLELTISTYEEAKFYYEKEEEIHQRRLVYYIAKYGYFLRNSKGLRDLLEEYLAYREGVSQLPLRMKDAAGIIKPILNTTGQPLQKENFTRQLELWADYCYLRNQRTYEAFSFLKRQLYFVFGIALGIGIAHLLDIGGTFLKLASSSAQPPILGGASGLLNGIRVSVASFFSPQPGWSWIDAGVGVAMGAGSQPAHAVTNWISTLPIMKPPQYAGAETITSPEIGRR